MQSRGGCGILRLQDLIDCVTSFPLRERVQFVPERSIGIALGKAFEPEQRFENPDETPIIFDIDLQGNRRDGMIIPGPFADGLSGKIIL